MPGYHHHHCHFVWELKSHRHACSENSFHPHRLSSTPVTCILFSHSRSLSSVHPSKDDVFWLNTISDYLTQDLDFASIAWGSVSPHCGECVHSVRLKLNIVDDNSLPSKALS